MTDTEKLQYCLKKLRELEKKLGDIASSLTFVEGSFTARLDLRDSQRKLADILRELEK